MRVRACCLCCPQESTDEVGAGAAWGLVSQGFLQGLQSPHTSPEPLLPGCRGPAHQGMQDPMGAGSSGLECPLRTWASLKSWEQGLISLALRPPSIRPPPHLAVSSARQGDGGLMSPAQPSPEPRLSQVCTGRGSACAHRLCPQPGRGAGLSPPRSPPRIRGEEAVLPQGPPCAPFSLSSERPQQGVHPSSIPAGAGPGLDSERVPWLGSDLGLWQPWTQHGARVPEWPSAGHSFGLCLLHPHCCVSSPSSSASRRTLSPWSLGLSDLCVSIYLCTTPHFSLLLCFLCPAPCPFSVPPPPSHSERLAPFPP